MTGRARQIAGRTPTHTTRSATDAGRLLPWTTLEGKSCYVMGDGTGYISRVADTVEGLQLEMAAELLAHAADLLADNRASSVQRDRMTEALRDVVRIATAGAPAFRLRSGKKRRPGTPAEAPPSTDKSKRPRGRNTAIRYICNPVHRSPSRTPRAPPSRRAEWISRGRMGRGASSW
ncbi:hypothetical protein [Streptomyces zagrosensis]|uniref:Uncharacterized protein n=1 Tax=Streptomyces zagrosensis TaxID=1042984 RepID=A0A7W9UXL1_9ACTN|nr:hypothetical protein [Streptomyces zagrosensis]MBB5934980.1 hypothetical protein [Streptomyces zagrosensis]